MSLLFGPKINWSKSNTLYITIFYDRWASVVAVHIQGHVWIVAMQNTGIGHIKEQEKNTCSHKGM
jgi:hypothetical protein